MRRKMTIRVGEELLPCYQTLGALVRYKDATGEDVPDLKGVKDMALYLWCCVKSACAREKIEFKMEFLEFCDILEPDDLLEWHTLMAGEQGSGDEEKKSPSE